MMELSINHVTKTYKRGQKKALNEFNATFTPGIYGILGPNGAGKSTLMHLITDQLLPSKGEIIYNGQSIHQLGASYRSILGFMPQQQELYDDFTGRRFLWYLAALKGLSRTDTKVRVEELLETVNLTDDADRRIGTYSGGMKQRILIAQALLNDPEILILDEPTAGVDPRERVRLRNFISTIATNKIVLLATHVVSDIEYIAKEVLLMNHGNLIRKNTATNIMAEIDGKVFEALVTEPDLKRIQANFKVSNIVMTPEGINVRFLKDADTVLDGIAPIKAVPNLEDVYLYFFES